MSSLYLQYNMHSIPTETQTAVRQPAVQVYAKYFRSGSLLLTSRQYESRRH